MTFFSFVSNILRSPCLLRLCRQSRVHLPQPHQCLGPRRSSLIIPPLKAALSPHLVSECQTHCTAESAAVSLHRILGTALLFSHSGFALDTDTSCIREQGHRAEGDSVCAAPQRRERERAREWLYLAGAHSSLITLQLDTLGMSKQQGRRSFASAVEVRSVDVAAAEHSPPPTGLLCLRVME